MEDKIIEIISMHSPFSFDDCKSAWKILGKSYDKLIIAINFACGYNYDLSCIASSMRQI